MENRILTVKKLVDLRNSSSVRQLIRLGEQDSYGLGSTLLQLLTETTFKNSRWHKQHDLACTSNVPQGIISAPYVIITYILGIHNFSNTVVIYFVQRRWHVLANHIFCMKCITLFICEHYEFWATAFSLRTQISLTHVFPMTSWKCITSRS